MVAVAFLWGPAASPRLPCGQVPRGWVPLPILWIGCPGPHEMKHVLGMKAKPQCLA